MAAGLNHSDFMICTPVKPIVLLMLRSPSVLMISPFSKYINESEKFNFVTFYTLQD